MNREVPPWLPYLTPIGWLIAFLQYRRSEVKSTLLLLHLRQMTGLLLMLFALWIVQAVYVYIPSINYLTIPCYLLLFVLWGKGFVDAIQKKEKPIPMIGKWMQWVCNFIY